MFVCPTGLSSTTMPRRGQERRKLTVNGQQPTATVNKKIHKPSTRYKYQSTLINQPTINQMLRSLSITSNKMMLFITILFFSALQLSQSYPIIFETDHNDQQVSESQSFSLLLLLFLSQGSMDGWMDGWMKWLALSIFMYRVVFYG